MTRAEVLAGARATLRALLERPARWIPFVLVLLAAALIVWAGLRFQGLP